MGKEGMSRQSFWIFLVIVFAIIIATFIFFYSMSDKFQSEYVDVDPILIQEGLSVEVEENSILGFEYESKPYSLFINEFFSSGISFRIGVKTYQVLFSEQSEIDLNKDGEDDLIVGAKSSGQENFLYLEFIDNSFCEESWDCTDWGPCIDAVMKRVCLDQNQCDTFEFKPEVRRNC